MPEPLIFELSREGRVGVSLPESDVPQEPLHALIPPGLLRGEPPDLPEISEGEVVRHFVRLSSMNYHVDRGFYPLGSCTMKYNPKLNEKVAQFQGFTGIHPLLPAERVQGALRLMKDLEIWLAEIGGLDAVTLEPAAGAHGELTGMMIIRRFHEKQGNPRRYVLIPDSAHGTNPASVTIAGYLSKTVPSNEEGLIDLKALKENLSGEVAALMVTNPNTLGLFERDVLEFAEMVHEVGGLVYMDGANLNALLGICKPGDMGFDVVHFNLHKTFSTPHGGGGPGSGPIGVKRFLEPFLPVPRIVEMDGRLQFSYDFPDSIGKVHSFFGNFLVMVRAYAYILTMGPSGLRRVAEDSLINSNYLRVLLRELFDLPYDRISMHEFVLSGKPMKSYGVRTLDVAKRLLDYGFHAPTVYFPLIVPEALMIEPTETETKETLDGFRDAMEKIAEEAKKDPTLLKGAPYSTPVGRLDEAKAARELDVAHLE